MDTKRDKRLAAREDRKRRAAAAQQRAKIGRLVAALVGLLVLALVGFFAFTTSLFGLVAPSVAGAQVMPLGKADHVAEGTPIEYHTRPPTSGPHFATWSQAYGVLDREIPPGLWVHNLEHGAIVLLYNCPEGCPELVSQIRQLHSELPPGRNARGNIARLLALPYTDMDHKIAVIAWGRLLELDEFDGGRIRQFYDAFIDRGPECRDLRCPS